MSSPLAPCPGCERHVRTGEIACPFCGASTIALVAPPVRPWRRSGRLALVAGAMLLGSGCGSSSAEPEPAQEEPVSSGDQPPAEEPASEEPAPEDPGGAVEMYGGPPLDEIV